MKKWFALIAIVLGGVVYGAMNYDKVQALINKLKGNKQ